MFLLFVHLSSLSHLHRHHRHCRHGNYHKWHCEAWMCDNCGIRAHHGLHLSRPHLKCLDATHYILHTNYWWYDMRRNLYQTSPHDKRGLRGRMHMRRIFQSTDLLNGNAHMPNQHADS